LTNPFVFDKNYNKFVPIKQKLLQISSIIVLKLIKMKDYIKTICVVCMTIATTAFNVCAQTTAPAKFEAMKNPNAGSAVAAAAGKKLYVKYCAVCHGDKGKGNGIAAAGLPKPPADHTSASFQKTSDGAIFWITSEGKGKTMPPFKASLKEAEIWNLVSFMRTLAKSSK
jgi:mono/diheme cytochrome c family protein